MGKIRLFGTNIPLPFLLLAMVELCLISGCVVLAASLRFDGDLREVYRTLGPLLHRALFYACIMVLSLGAMGLYQIHFREGYLGQLLRVFAGCLLGWGILAVLYYLIPSLYVGRGVASMSLVFSVAIVVFLRPAFYSLVDLDSLKPRVLILGAGEKAAWIMRSMYHRSNRRGFCLIGFVDTGGIRHVNGDVPVLKLDGSLSDYIQRCRVDQIVVAVDDRRNNLPMQDLLDCRLAGVEVVDLATFFEQETSTVALELVDASWLVFGQGFRHGILLAGIKRSLDILLSAMLLVLFWPVILLAALAIKLEDGLHVPVFYSQIRVGRGRLPFKLYKLRSMRVDAERTSGACWAQANDNRITHVGKVIRKCRIDELPQIFNVLRGDMSFVGPRPERPEFTQELEKRIRYYRERCAVKPGLTGWAQLRYPYGASDRDASEKLKYDLFYIKNHNTFFDLLILLQTVEVVVFGKGAR